MYPFFVWVLHPNYILFHFTFVLVRLRCGCSFTRNSNSNARAMQNDKESHQFFSSLISVACSIVCFAIGIMWQRRRWQRQRRHHRHHITSNSVLGRSCLWFSHNFIPCKTGKSSCVSYKWSRSHVNAIVVCLDSGNGKKWIEQETLASRSDSCQLGKI